MQPAGRLRQECRARRLPTACSHVRGLRKAANPEVSDFHLNLPVHPRREDILWLEVAVNDREGEAMRESDGQGHGPQKAGDLHGRRPPAPVQLPDEAAKIASFDEFVLQAGCWACQMRRISAE